MDFKHFNIKNINSIDLKCIKIIYKDISNVNIYSCKKYNDKLYKVKKLIDNDVKKWDYYKKITNMYEYVNTSPYKYLYISKEKHLSRSFYKLIEIVKRCEILMYFKFIPINTFHLAEGPGGFIEAISYLRNNKKDNYIGMTLINNNINTPGWYSAKKFLENNKNVHIEYGADKTGNLYNSKNFEYCYKKYKNKMNLITADGGFDFSINFKNQEINAYRLILTQVFYALIMQKKNGIFILKIYDSFIKSTIDIIYFLSCFYKNIQILKPNTSRTANSEKYIICIDFNDNIDFYSIFLQLLKEFETVDFNKKYIEQFLNIDYNLYFKNKINKINTFFSNTQIINIINTLDYINNNKNINYIKKNNIKKSILWFKTFDIPYNNIKIRN